MNRQRGAALLLIAVVAVVQLGLLWDRATLPDQPLAKLVQGALAVRDPLGPAAQLGLLVVHGLFVFVGVWTVAADRRRSVGLYLLGYVVLLGVLAGVAGATLMFLLMVMLYAAVYHVPLLVGFVFLFVASYRLMYPYSLAVFVLGALLLVGAAGLIRGRHGPFLAGSHLVGFALLAVILLPLIYMVTQTSVQDVFLAAGREDVRSAIWLSLTSSTITTLVVLLLGVPLAYVMVRADFPGRNLADNLLDLPILIPQPVVAIAILTCLAPRTKLGAFLASTRLGGLLSEPLGFHIDGTIWGIVAAQVFVSSPFLVRAAMAAFQGVDPKLEKVARTLGARPWQAFWSVSLPLAAKGIFTGCILTWSRAISEYGAVAMITYDPACAPVKIYDEATAHGVPEARPAAVLLVMTCLWIFVMLRLVRAYPLRGPLGALLRRPAREQVT